jgi:hypothetical protein
VAAILDAFGSTGSFTTTIRFLKSKSAAGRSASADRSAWTSSHWSNCWMQTNGPQGGDAIALARNSIDHVFMGRMGGGVSRSTDDGEPWAGINNGLTATNVRALAISLAGDIVAGTFGDAFRSSDNEGSWLRSITVWRFRL